MRILHVDPERRWGGGEVQVAALLRELVRRGHESVLAAAPDAPIARIASGLGVRVVPCAIANDLDLRAVPTLRASARGVDVVHLHTARAHAMAPWLRGLGVRLVVTRRMDYVPRRGPWTRHLYNRAVDRVIAISDGVRAALVAAGVDAARIRVVPSGIELDRCVPAPDARARLRRAWGATDEAVVAIVVGALETRKGHATLLAAAAAAGRALRYVFCGAGSQEGALREVARARGVPVEFLGFRSDVADCLAAADVAVLPSRHEGLGVAALEAMAVSRPVVASRVGGLAEVVEDGVTGRLVPPDDPPALGAALATLAATPATRAAMGDAGRERVRARYSSVAMADGTIACYLEPP